MFTYILYRDGKEIKRFENQDNDFCILKYILDNTSQSMHYAFRYDGYSCKYFEQEKPDIIYDYNILPVPKRRKK